MVLCGTCKKASRVVLVDHKNRDPPAPLDDHGDCFRTPSKMISVHVGLGDGPKTVFTLHEHILRRCPFFSQGLDGGFTEGSTQEFKSFEDDPLIFGLLVEFLYTGLIRYSDGKAPSREWYFHLWVLGDFLNFVEVQNYCAWILLTGYDKDIVIPPEKLPELFNAAPKLGSTPMQRFIVDVIIWTDLDTDLLGDMEPEMTRRVIGELKAKGKADMKSPLWYVRNYYVGADSAEAQTPKKSSKAK